MTNQADRRRYPQWLWVFSILVLLLTSVPYVLGYATQGDEWVFSGFVFGVEDGNSYMAKMLRGAAGEWLFRTPYTALPQQGVLAFAPYYLLGKLTSPPGQHEQLVALFHLFRWGSGIAAILASYDFLSLFLREASWRRWGVILVNLGGGLGWLLILLGQGDWLGSLPLGIYSPETFGFLSLFGLPHLALARALFLWGLCVFLFPEFAPKSIKAGIFVGLLWLLMGLMQPLTVVLAWVVLGSFVGMLTLIWVWKFWFQKETDWPDLRIWYRRSAWVVAVSAPIVIYTFWVFNTDPVLKAWTGQNLILSPHPGHYLIAYGLLIPFAVPGVLYLIKQRKDPSWLLLSWSLALPFLVYAPYPLQRRLAEGYWVVLVTMALASFENIAKPRLLVLRWLLLLCLPTTLLLLAGGTQAAGNPRPPIFRPRAEVQAFEWLSAETELDQVVLASYETGNALPAWAAVHVLIGHGPESIDLAELRPRIARFYLSETPDTERIELLDEFRVDYVFWGPTERALGDWDPDAAEYLNILFDHDGYRIFSATLSQD